MVKIAIRSETVCEELECVECDGKLKTDHYLLSAARYSITFKVVEKYYTLGHNQCIGIHQSCCGNFAIFGVPDSINVLTHSADQ